MRKRRYRRKSRWPLVLVLVLLVAFGFYAYNRVKPDVEHAIYPLGYREIVEEQAAAYGLEESLVYAVIKAESDFDAEAESAVGALGLMQMMPDTFTWMQTRLGETYETQALLRPEISVRYGCALLRLLLDQYEDLTVALCAYNAGMGNVTSWLSDTAYSADGTTLQKIPFGETRIYVEKVLRYKENYEMIYGGMENG